jgi:hypothetical protein
MRNEGDEHDRNAADRGPRTSQEEMEALRVREKAHTREGDAIGARERLPMVEVDAATPVVGAAGEVPLIDTFEGRSQLFASYHMWHSGLPAADQCEGGGRDHPRVLNPAEGARRVQLPHRRAALRSLPSFDSAVCRRCGRPTATRSQPKLRPRRGQWRVGR